MENEKNVAPLDSPPVTSVDPASPVTTIKNPGRISGRLIFLVLILLTILVGAGGVYAISQFNKKTPPPKVNLYEGKIMIGYAKWWPGYVGLFIANEKGYFKEAGLNVEIKSFDSLAESYNQYEKGNIEGLIYVSSDALDLLYKGVDHKIVMAIDQSNGSDGIIGNKKIKSFQDIKGKRVAYEKGTLEEFIIRFVLEKNYLKIEDVISIDLNAEKAADAVVNNTVDVGVTYDPFMSKALEDEEIHKLFSTDEVPGLITDILTFRTKFINENPETISAFITAYLKGVKFWKENPKEAQVIIAKYLETTEDLVPGQLSGVKILDENDNEKAFTYSVGLESLYGNLKNADRFRNEQKTNEFNAIDTDSLIEKRFIKKITHPQ